MTYKKTTLPNGVRVITVPAKGSPTATVFVAVEVGSNNESREQNGLSHFLEHMVFKGTTKRPTPLDIALEFDMIGAENNAFTSNEYTGYYGKAGKKHWKKLLEVVSDMYLDPIFPQAELDKERGVILQEISMYEDLPQRKVQKVFDELLYGDTPQGRTILGPAENIKRFTREDFINYRSAFYAPERTIVVVAGDVPQEAFVKEVTKLFKDLKKGKKVVRSKPALTANKPGLLIEKKKTDQTHIVLGFRTVGVHDKLATTLDVLAGVLSSGMSSRLFKKLRDEMGACYYVRANHSQYSTYGDFTISTGINQSRLEEVVKVLIDECRKLKDELVTEEELAKVKDYMVSHLYMGLETTDALAYFFGLDEAVRGKAETPEELEEKIRAVKAKDIQNAARKIFINGNLNLAAVGNVTNENAVRKVLSF